MYVVSSEVVAPAASLISAIVPNIEFGFERALPLGADQIYMKLDWEDQNLRETRKMQQERYSELLAIRRGTF